MAHFQVVVLFIFLGLCVFVSNLNLCSPFPCPSTRPVKIIVRPNHPQFDYTFICQLFEEFVILTSLVCFALLKSANSFLKNIRFINFNTCLNYLAPYTKIPQRDHNLLTYLSLAFTQVYFFDIYLLLALSVDFHSLLSRIVIENLLFLFKLYSKSLSNFLYIFKMFFSELSPRFQILSLWIFGLLIFLSSDIETNPGPKSSGTAAPASGFSNSFFSFCNWNVNTLSKMTFRGYPS